MTQPVKARNLFFVLLGVAVLVLKGYYVGPFGEIVHNYGGNASASCAVFFVVGLAPISWKYPRLMTACLALLVVELFEATDGFGLMTNVYDPFDYLANALGVALAGCLDLLSARLTRARSPSN